MTKIIDFAKLARPKHWVKNILVFVPVVYAGGISDFGAVFAAFMSFVAFCLVASAVYVLNDIVDCEKDTAHPVNRTRPVASGRVGKSSAAFFASFLTVAGFSVALLFGGWVVMVFAFAYVLLNLFYSFFLKHVPVLDCFCIAAGFVIRIYAGGGAVGEGISEWLFLTVTFGALFMAFGKRRGEAAQVGAGSAARRVLKGYDLGFLSGVTYTCAGITVVFYALWAMGSEPPLMIYTIPLVAFIICKYLLNAQAEDSFGDPVSIIFQDKPLICAVALFGVLSIVFLYM
ncbi:MAG: decaprenyl-phosphate phosphoribosyltransferase [Defluviitaleaceae bacterium]|nr:decaprenyl-phosphate phosphoribosyltransferase [Defluviitaleaceae bacterium]